MAAGTYVHGYGEAFQRCHNNRTLVADAPFIIPYLRSGLTLLDCGCGPGSITCDLAEVVAPGHVTGIDISDVQLARARELARRRGIANIHFETGDIYELPFADQSFDVTFAHNVLEHLPDPLRALREMRRVLNLEESLESTTQTSALGCTNPKRFDQQLSCCCGT